MEDGGAELQIAKLDDPFGFEACKISESTNSEALRPLVFQTTKLDFYLAIFVCRGSGKILVDFDEYEIDYGSFIFVSRAQLIKLVENNNLDAILFIITEEFLSELFDGRGILPFSRLFSYHQFSPVIKFSDNQFRVIYDAAQSILEEYRRPENYGYKEVLQLRLKLIMYQLVRQRERRLIDSHEPRSIKLFANFNRLVMDNFIKVKSAHDYARMLKVSYKTLNQVSKANINKTAKAYIEYYTILEIKRSLAYSSMSIQEVAYKYGFDEPTNMVKFFKKHTHLTPSQFRKEKN